MTAAQILTAESYARGIAEGKAEGMAEGKAEGVSKGKAELLLRQLNSKFGAVTDATRETVLRASSERMDVWAERVLTGTSIEEILA